MEEVYAVGTHNSGCNLKRDEDEVRVEEEEGEEGQLEQQATKPNQLVLFMQLFD